MKLGDAIEQAVKPVAQALNLPCLDANGNLLPQSGCAQRRETLNYLGDAVYDIFWPKKNVDSKPDKPE